jgi:hypothetical protein
MRSIGHIAPRYVDFSHPLLFPPENIMITVFGSFSLSMRVELLSHAKRGMWVEGIEEDIWA